MTLLEVFIPTYNRPEKFEACLRSLENSLSRLDKNARHLVGITINSNSTRGVSTYESIIEKYKVSFLGLGVSYFEYRVTGFNIGGINNIVGGIFSAKAEYVWCLPDDDLARFDSLSILISVIQAYWPSFISGAWHKKSMIDYESDENGDDDGHENGIFDVIDDREKISAFLSKNVVQLQEYVYRTKVVKNFLIDKENRSLLNDMFPGLFALVCLRENEPFVRLERSIGIFRDGDPRSGWRHLWYRFALIDWPVLCEKLLCRGWLSPDEYRVSIGVYRPMLVSLSKRPDILLGLNRKYQVNPFLLLKYHQSAFFKTLGMMPASTFKAILRRLRR
jgi:hypothetical protein